MKTYLERASGILDEAEDLLEDVTCYLNDEGDPKYLGLLHKLQEAIGPLRSAHAAAEQAQ